MISTIILFLSSVSAIIWSLSVLIFKPFGINLYRISEPNLTFMAFKKLPKICSIVEGEHIRGWFWGYPYIGYVNEVQQSNQHGNSTMYYIYILTTKSYYTSITTHEQKQEDKKKEVIPIYERQGSYYYLHYEKRDLSVEYFNPTDKQTVVLNKIITNYNTSKENNRPHFTAIVWGNPGSGKSMVPILLAKQLNASLCDTFNPTDPGDSLTRLYNTVCPTEENPLILVLEEYDILINKFHTGFKQNDNIPTLITNKIDWNTFFDRIDRHMYPHLIVILTSNQNPKSIDTIDSSYIRKGRIDLRIALHS